ncbi:MutT/nudix family protein [Mycobacteroides abscessus subsp. massiliense]|nr:MutT/nudix family protein [Mycobacteroides abscessus subsp. massiliense]
MGAARRVTRYRGGGQPAGRGAGEVVNAIAVAGILATYVALGGHHTRPVDAPWPDRPTAFAERKAAT